MMDARFPKEGPVNAYVCVDEIGVDGRLKLTPSMSIKIMKIEAMSTVGPEDKVYFPVRLPDFS